MHASRVDPAQLNASEPLLNHVLLDLRSFCQGFLKPVSLLVR
jgi:hypothetical protein